MAYTIGTIIFISRSSTPVTGVPVPDGEVGEIVITTLVKEGAPLLRFRTRDLSRIIPEKCSCGSAFPRLDTIQGRSDDMFKVRGVNMFPRQVEELLGTVEGAERVSDRHIPRRGRARPHGADRRGGGRRRLRADWRRDTRAFQSRIGMTPEVEVVPHGTLARSMKKTKRVIDQRYD